MRPQLHRLPTCPHAQPSTPPAPAPARLPRSKGWEKRLSVTDTRHTHIYGGTSGPHAAHSTALATALATGRVSGATTLCESAVEDLKPRLVHSGEAESADRVDLLGVLGVLGVLGALGALGVLGSRDRVSKREATCKPCCKPCWGLPLVGEDCFCVHHHLPCVCSTSDRGYTDSLTCVYHACHRYLLISYESDRTFATTWSSVRRTNAVQTTKGVSLERRARKR